ncbi:helix-turn-helix transcriptional regulator [Neorhizobium sp. LMR1-1-1.1]
MDQTNFKTSAIGAEKRQGARLRDARLSKNYSLEDLAIATGLTEAEISAIEDGTSDNAHHAERIEHSLS